MMVERDLAQEQREAAARDKADGWVSVFVQWIPSMLLSVVMLGAMMFGMYYIEHGTLDITQPIVNQYITQ
ncbi:hypothetical protein FKE98_03420 [Corynebacterium aurimucosum]|uniref:ABC transporter permease n=3 Tax=Corynebacterium TaxID=1716 RepID=A0ABY3CTI1_9CORY|nr:hypothetical protein [Corynebacterium guaraldiae]NJJ83701.1 hypothetical protein [Corynebacterium aurimucosum]OFK27321.1 hypothetical protein HMPREF2822_12155 [Corynebacterium sp. HMSC062E11]OFK62324.1 hypothetical protein HMPREF2808_11910 [Corynebacterium sp. HMSC078A10]OFK91366.1 hypothetical protein HMPREF2792_04575 [Corynebacterium sp. HMSC068H04]OFL61305.1 hypothetical protein HMPREF2760_08785 [Corynebacterium sp. HMSC065D07]OFM33311.1 hypothetical protein HMPREF2698_06980 [Corynebact